MLETRCDGGQAVAVSSMSDGLLKPLSRGSPGEELVLGVFGRASRAWFALEGLLVIATAAYCDSANSPQQGRSTRTPTHPPARSTVLRYDRNCQQPFDTNS